MIKLSSADVIKAAEALSYQEAVNRENVRRVERLPEDDMVKIASEMRLDQLSPRQADVADRMGRELARSLAKTAATPAGTVMQALAPIGRSLKKSFTFARTRALKGKKVGLGTATKQVAKDVAPVAGTAYMGARALSADGQ